MARRAIEPMKDEHVNVTPLIDVVMCLIIFFLLVGQMAKDEAVGNIKVPNARTPMEMVDSEGRLIINVLAQEDLKSPDGKSGVVPPKVFVRGKEVPYTMLTDVLRSEKMHDNNLRLALRADSVLSYEYIAPILISCSQAKIGSVNFATRQGIPEGNTK
jgi:biopolymer transport protein ExbD